MKDIPENGTASYDAAWKVDQTKNGVSYVCYAPLNEIGRAKVNVLGKKAGSAKVVTEIQKQYLTWLKEK